MIRFNCDRCDMEIEVDDELAGSKHKCLNCGDVNRVPSPVGVEPGGGDEAPKKDVDRAAKAGYPADFGPEQRVFKVRRCWFRSRPIRFSFMVLLLIAGIVGSLWVEVGDHARWYHLLFVPMSVGAVAFISWWWIDRLGAAFEVTTKRTVMHRGFFSRATSEVVHDNIRNIQVDQTFLQRVFGVGRIGISSSGQDGVEIQVNHLKAPDKLREIIDLYRPI